MITYDYTEFEFGVWSGWRELNSHSVSNSQIEKMFCKINSLN